MHADRALLIQKYNCASLVEAVSHNQQLCLFGGHMRARCRIVMIPSSKGNELESICECIAEMEEGRVNSLVGRMQRGACFFGFTEECRIE